MAADGQYNDSARAGNGNKREHASLPSIKHLQQILTYDPITGDLRWAITKGRCRAGRLAGCVSANGYRNVWILSKCYGVHRVAWKMHHGVDPNGVIDHINGNRTDNRIANLRDVSQSINCRNRKRQTNTTVWPGVTWHAAREKWRVMAGGAYIGSNPCLGQAIRLRKKAETKSGYSTRHWRPVGKMAAALVAAAERRRKEREAK